MRDVDTISLQPAEVDDAKILTETCKQAFDSDSEVGAPGLGGPPGYDSLDWNIGIIKNQYLQYYKIVNGNRIIGGFIVSDRGIDYQVCERIWVDPEHMREGIGTRAFKLVWELYPSAEVWTLGTPEWNTRTNPFYQSLGFTQIGKTHAYTWDGIFYEKKNTDAFPKAMSRIGELREGQMRIIVEGRVESISSTRIVKSRKTGEDLRVADATLRDETGSIKLVLWNNQIPQVREDTNIRIEEGFAKTYRDELQMSVGKWGMIITLI